MALIVYRNANILDGTEDMTLQKNMSIFVEDGKIVKIISADDVVPEDAKIIDLNNKYVVPGLINLHCHLPGSGKSMNVGKANTDLAGLINKLLKHRSGRSVLKKMCYKSAKAALLSGVTTIRTVGGIDTLDSQLRDEINAGKLTGPNILAADKAVSVPGGHMAGLLAYAATSPEEAAGYVDEIAKSSPDLIKLMVTGGVLDADESGTPGAMKMTEDEIKAACERAHELGLYVAAHVESAEGVRASLVNGVNTIEHGATLDEELIALFKEKDAKLICTLSPAMPQKLLPADKLPDEKSKINGTIVCDGIINAAKSAIANDITIGLGNDAGCPYTTHYDFWRELVYFSKYIGVDALKTIHIATQGNAEIAGVEELTGSIQPGRLADMIVLEQNPAENLSILRNPAMVIKSGRIVKGKFKRYKNVDEVLDGMKI